MTRPPRRTSSGPRPGQRRHPATRRPVLDGARLTAYDVLDGVSSRAAYANLLLPQLLRERQLDERDAAFATQLAYGTLRAQGTLDAVLAGLVSRPLDELDPRVLDLLRLGAYQLIDLRVPSHAAVDTTVDLTRGIVGTGASGLVNAVLRSVREGAAAVQDEGSQLAALLLARAPLEGPDGAWLDLCAGPGGKTGLLAAVRPDGVRLTAADRAPHRAELVARAVAGEPDVEVLAADSTAPPWAPGSFDRVLLDAPCTGLGALRRRPEVRWRRTPDDVPPLVELQTALLASALSSVRGTGHVGDDAADPHRAETVAVVDAAAARDDVDVVPVPPLFPEVPDMARGEHGQLWPHRHGTDAMFMALLRRTR